MKLSYSYNVASYWILQGMVNTNRKRSSAGLLIFHLFDSKQASYDETELETCMGCDLVFIKPRKLVLEGS